MRGGWRRGERKDGEEKIVGRVEGRRVNLSRGEKSESEQRGKE